MEKPEKKANPGPPFGGPWGGDIGLGVPVRPFHAQAHGAPYWPIAPPTMGLHRAPIPYPGCPDLAGATDHEAT